MQNKRSQGRRIVFKALGILAGGIFLIVGVQERLEFNRVKRLGETAVVAPITGYTRYKSHGLTTYTAEFRFKTRDSREIVQKHSFPEELIADFSAGRSVRVLYLPQEPSTFIFEKETPSWLLILGGIGMAGLAVLFI